MQYSVHPPSEFIAAHSEKLLPEWSHPIRSIVVVLQPADRELTELCRETDLQKQKLRSQFLEFGFKVAESLKDHLVELFDPKTGFPVLSGAGSLRLDDVAVVRSTLGYTIAPVGNCLTIVHPLWGRAVYPSILMSSAEMTLVESAVAGLVECHHSFRG
ncbi:methylmalonic aciduria and homocystinuria type D protein [Pseudanabaenaceae cyanobacterium LEGE 13415]|nr:methylmalonic aciduria and homocystinuria type D protein [Pseudanabaenaceae cyanobacterium LEGE 13415]